MALEWISAFYRRVDDLITELIEEVDRLFWLKETLWWYLLVSAVMMVGVLLQNVHKLLIGPIALYQSDIYVHCATLNLLLSLELYGIGIFIDKYLMGLSQHESKQLNITFRSAGIDAATVWYYFLSTSTKRFFIVDPLKFLVIYIGCSTAVHVLMHRCHTLCVEMIEDPVKRDELLSVHLFLSGVCLLSVSSWSTYTTFECFGLYGEYFYLQLAMRFALTTNNLVYTFLWCRLSVQELNARRLPGYFKRADIERDRLLCFLCWDFYQVACIFYDGFLVLWKSQDPGEIMGWGYWTDSVVSIMRDDNHTSLLGYRITRKARLDGARLEDFTDTECIICFEEMVPNDLNVNSTFGSQDSTKLVCGHIFHYDCFNRWCSIRDVCPTCNGPVFRASPVEYMGTFNRS